MTSNTNINSDKSEAQLYEVLLYKKKDIIAIQKKLSMLPDRRKGLIENIYQTALNQSKKGKTLEDSFGLLFDLVRELIDIREDLDVVSHPILTILYENMQDFDEVTFGKMSLRILYHLLLYLEEDISVIQDHLGIAGHSDLKISGLEEANKNARAYLQNF
ncbi:hypothetical protein C1645_830582 [Glomus cerebriforme]|uniref:Uncharacterized protein n=1 Tax=Glomus cerebriforme TaxID=658196 RepID=A0A397SHS4_9GLOM|nr:hypothetical protein C1645_830582 [Glomus cerebriforme]